MEKAQFGAFVAQNRKQLGLTQKQLAEMLHVTDKAVSKWERGLSYPDVTLLEPIAEALKMDVSDLIACRTREQESDWETEHPVSSPRESNASEISTLLDISTDNLRRERSRHRFLLIPLTALLLAAVTMAVILLNPNRTTETDSLEVVHAEETEDELLLYTEKDGHLLCLHYGPAEDKAALADRIAEGCLLQAEYRWNQRTMQGLLLRWSAEEGSIVLGSPMEEVGSATDLCAYDGDALFGYERVMMKIVSRVPASGGGYLSDYIFYAGDDSEDWYLHADEELLRVSDCLGFGSCGDIGFCTEDIDGDGVRELLARTPWPEKPCIVYDRTEAGVSETWLDTIPDALSAPVE